MIATDLAGTVVFWNAGAERLYGWTAEEAIGQNIGALTVPTVSEEIAADIMAALREGVPWSGGFPVRRKDGTVFPALVTDSGVYRDGELVGIVGISANLGTALRPLLERSTDAAVVVRADAVITYASPAVRALFGWDDATVIGTSIVPLVHPDDRDALAEFLSQVTQRPGAYAPLELRIRRPDATWVWVEAALTNMLDDPIVRGVVCNLHLSVTRLARERAEERIAQLQEALDSRVVIEQAKGFLAGRDGVHPDAGFERLRRYARDHDLALRDVARQLVDGTLTLLPEVLRRLPGPTTVCNRCGSSCADGFPCRMVLPSTCCALDPALWLVEVEDAMSGCPRTYQVLCSSVGSTWAVRIPELDREASAARLSQVEAVARALVTTYAPDDGAAVDFTIELMPDAISAGLAAAATARAKAVRSPVDEVLTRRSWPASCTSRASRSPTSPPRSASPPVGCSCSSTPPTSVRP